MDASYWFVMYLFWSQNDLNNLNDYVSRHSVFNMTASECELKRKEATDNYDINKKYYYVSSPCMKYDIRETGLDRFLEESKEKKSITPSVIK